MAADTFWSMDPLAPDPAERERRERLDEADVEPSFLGLSVEVAPGDEDQASWLRFLNDVAREDLGRRVDEIDEVPDPNASLPPAAAADESHAHCVFVDRILRLPEAPPKRRDLGVAHMRPR